MSARKWFAVLVKFVNLAARLSYDTTGKFPSIVQPHHLRILRLDIIIENHTNRAS